MSPWVPAAWLFVSTFGVLYHVSRHGEARDDQYNGPGRFIATVIIGALLWWGGFFGALKEWL